MTATDALVARVLRAYGERGLGGVIKAGAQKAAAAVFDTNGAWWLGRDLRLTKPAPKPIPDVQLSDSFEETARWLAARGERWMAHEREMEAARAGRHLFINAKCGGQVVGYIKAGFGQVYIQDYRRLVSFPPGVAFIYDTYVCPEERRRGLGRLLIERACALLAEMGYRCVLCHIPAWNAASLAAYGRAGFSHLGHVRYFRVLGLGFTTASPSRLAARHGLS